MKTGTFSVAVVLTLAFSGSANADLVEVSVIYGPHQHPDGLHNTLQVIAMFSDPGDQISSVNGLPELNSLDLLIFGGELYNQALFGGLPLNDFPSAGDIGGELWDSYVTIGATSFPSNTHFTPDFLGDWGGAPPPVQVIEGNQFHEDDGAWYFLGSPPVVGDLPDAVPGNDTSDVVIAQFTIDIGSAFIFNGNIAWLNASDGSNNTPFDVAYPWPTPGTLVLFGIAGLTGVRKRRD